MSSDETRDAILKEAYQLIAERGPDAFSMREVARRAEISIGALQYHYSDRRSLVSACLDSFVATYTRLSQRLFASLDDERSLDEVFSTAVRLGFRHARRHQAYTRLLTSNAVRDEGGLEDSRIADHQLPFAREMAKWAAPKSSQHELTLAFRFNAIIVLIGRYATYGQSTLELLTGQSGRDAVGAIEDQLVTMLLAMAK